MKRSFSCSGFTAVCLYNCVVMQIGLGVCEFGMIRGEKLRFGRSGQADHGLLFMRDRGMLEYEFGFTKQTAVCNMLHTAICRRFLAGS